LDSKYSFKHLDIVNVLFLLLTPIAAILCGWFWLQIDGFQYSQIILGIGFYLLTGISITAGYHRLFAHKAYDAHPLIKLFFLLFGAAAFENSVLKWASDHRLHHNKVDTQDDPYNINEGFFHAHMGWVFLKKNGHVQEKYAKDFRQDSLVLWQHKYYLIISVTTGLLLPTILGGVFFGSYFGGLAIGGFARIVLTHHCTFFINSLCHYLGTTPYTDTNSAKDSWFMALLTFGEGYHNFHHYFQTDYRNGIRWFHFDPTKWLIKSLSFSGLAFKLKLTPKEKILAAQMQMKLKELKHKVAPSEVVLIEVETLKSQVLEALEKLQILKDEYRANKKEFNRLAMLELRSKIESTKAEFDHCMEQWELLVNNYSLAYAYAKIGSNA
jgi:stearoyl-CoA desaturase (delta-9 desaturase)